MKVLFSQIKEYVPGLKAPAKEVGEVLTMIGFMMDGFDAVEYQGQKDYLMGLEVRENRGDCLSVLGLAREAAAYWGLKVKPPKIDLKLNKVKKHPRIMVEEAAKPYVERLLAVEIEGVKNQESPVWLKEFLELYGMNSINLLVDLSNYVMIVTGYPSHLLDCGKMTGALRWNMNKKFKQVTTLDGTKIELRKDREIILEDDKNILGLAGMVGGKEAALDDLSHKVILEMAIYDHATVRKNARDLRVITEAGTRLSKDLDPRGMEAAFAWLLALILEHASGEAGETLSYWPKKRPEVEVELPWEAPSSYAGIKIGKKEVVQNLEHLGFQVKEGTKGVKVIPPVGRTDINLMEDVLEEVVRMADFRNIPKEEIPALPVVTNITPAVVKEAERARDILTAGGLDEIMSLPLVQKGENKRANYLSWKEVITQNAVNEEYPALRQSLAIGLLGQLEEYTKKDIPAKETLFFEIGKVFGKKKGRYREHDALAVLSPAFPSLSSFRQKTLEKYLRSQGITDITYKKDEEGAVRMANPKTFYWILVNGKKLGVIYKLRPRKKATYFFEINLLKLAKILKTTRVEAVEELTEKVVTLDANKELGTSRGEIERFLKETREKIGAKYLWNLKIADEYRKGDKVKYTVRVSYKGLSDPKAKELHREVFGL